MVAETAKRFEIAPPDQEALRGLVGRVTAVAALAHEIDTTAEPSLGVTWRDMAAIDEVLPQRLVLGVGGESIRGVYVEATRVSDPRMGYRVARSGVVAEVGVGMLAAQGVHRLHYSVAFWPESVGDNYTVEAYSPGEDLAAVPHQIIALFGRAGLDQYVDLKLRLRDQTRAARRQLQLYRNVTAPEINALNALFNTRLS
jgi:hypothetical protein